MKAIAFLSMILFPWSALAFDFVNFEDKPEVRKELQIWDHKLMVSESFSDIQAGSSRVSLYKSFSQMSKSFSGEEIDESLRTLYFASIIPDYKWPTVLFMSEEQCDVDNFHETVINVNGQNVKVEGACSHFDSGDIMLGHFPVTKKGNDYIVRQFKDSNTVNVRFSRSSKVIPFDATGFREAWDDYGGKAL